MDGKKLTKLFLDYVDEESVSDLYAGSREIYEYLDQACGMFCHECGILHAEIVITTVASQQKYDLPPDYIRPYIQDRRQRFVGKYYDGDNYSWPQLTSYEKIYRANLTDEKTRPGRFAIIDKMTKEDLIQGTVDSDGAVSGGQCTLHDASMLFLTTDRVYPRDIIHNTTDGSDGYVLSVTDATHLVVALFDGTDNDWTSGDSYIIQPAAEQQVVLDAPSENSGHTITLPYVCMPSPVFSDYGFWRIPPRVCRAIAAGAAAIFQLPKREFKESAQIGGLFASEIKRMRNDIAGARLQGGMYDSRA